MAGYHVLSRNLLLLGSENNHVIPQQTIRSPDLYLKYIPSGKRNRRSALAAAMSGLGGEK